MTLPAELAMLPKPNLIDELSVTAILDRKKQALQQQFDASGLPFSVMSTAYDPTVIQLENSAMDEVVLRQRINEVGRARLLAFAEKADLDHLAAFYDVTRLADEADDRLKARTVLAIAGRSTGGTNARYRYVALSADLRVSDAIIYTTGRSPVIHVAIFSNAPNGVADDTLIERVQVALNATDVRMVNDVITVRTAIRTIVDISANVVLLPETPLTLLNEMKSNLLRDWDKEKALGRDLTISWWKSKLMIPGVHSVVPITPIGDVTIPPDQAAALGEITLNFVGRKT